MSSADAQTLNAEMEERVLKDINGTIYTNVEGFYQNYFENKPWSVKAGHIARAVVQAEAEAEAAGEGSLFSASIAPSFFLERLADPQSRFFDGRSTFCVSPSRSPGDDNGESDGDLHLPSLFLVPTSPRGKTREYDWADFLVLGETSPNTDSCREIFLRLCGHAQKLFTHQPTRRFLHCFNICGSLVEFWVFDRSGPYGCKAFDLQQHQERFIIAMVGYTEMSDDELGINTFVQIDDENREYILLRGEDQGAAGVERLYLQDQPIAFAPDLVCTGTTAYRAKRVKSKDWEYIVKFTWRADNGRREEDMLRLTKERKVWGGVQLFGHQDIDSIRNLRRNMEFGLPRRLLSTSEAVQPGNSNIVQTEQRGIIDGYTVEANPSVEKKGKVDPSFPNRLFTCLVVHPVGRAVDEFKSLPEFIGAFIDIVKGLRSLYKDGRILHQDVSKNNLMISDTQREGQPRGFLIDLDAAKLLDDPNAKDEITGTKLFMAIGVLKGRSHNYRHDLESLLYCFLWIASTYRQEGLPKDSNFYGWVLGSFDDCAKNKGRDMEGSEFENILSNFTSEFKVLVPLAREFRDILFPNQNYSLSMSSEVKDHDEDALYDQIIDAFDRALVDCVQSGKPVKI